MLAVCVLGLLLIPSAQATPGALDPTFGTGGKVTTAIGPGDEGVLALVRQPDGKLVAAGWSVSGSSRDFALARYKPDGSLDTSFNGTGKVTTAIGPGSDGAASLVLQPDGKLVAAGYSDNGSNYDFALARYNPNGSLDRSFSGTGKVTTPIGSGATAFALALQPDGKVVAAGSGHDGAQSVFALARYKPDGSLDPGFGVGGQVTTAIGPEDDEAHALVLQPDGKLVVAGRSSNGFDGDFALARYLGKDGCVVPKVKGKTLRSAKLAIRRAHCSVGKVTRAFSAKIKKGRVISQKPRPGKELAAGFKVRLTVSRGKKA